MKKTTVIGIAIAMAVLGGIAWAGQNAPRREKTQDVPQSIGKLTAAESAFDFGSISMVAGTVRHQFKIKNEGPELVSISTLYTSCMCTRATLKVDDRALGPFGMPGHGPLPRLSESLGAGAEAEVEVEFDPAAHGPAGVGRIQRTVTIENSTGQALELGIAALVTP